MYLLYKIIIKVMRITHTLFLLKDETFLKMYYYILTKKKLNLDNPQTFNEKIQWLKLHDRNPEYTKMVDKYEAKKYVAGLIGEEYIIPTIGVYDKFEDIDFDKLPNQFVMKCTHDSGGNIICKDKKELDIKKAKKKINKSLKKNYFYNGREWPYKNVKPRIIIEEYMEDESKKELKDYKIFCFGGNPKFLQVDFDRYIEHKRNVYSLDWKLLDVEIEFPREPTKIIEKPKKLDKMIEFAKKLSKNIPFVRVDFYSINENIYFGELTFYHGSGYEVIKPDKYNKKFGNMIRLPKKI